MASSGHVSYCTSGAGWNDARGVSSHFPISDLSRFLHKARATLRPGDEVRIPRFDKSGTVRRVDLRRNRAFVTVRAVEWELDLEELIPIRPSPP